jgi:hypothetical protein
VSGPLEIPFAYFPPTRNYVRRVGGKYAKGE